MPAVQPQATLITLEQYETLPDDDRMEVFDGIPYNMASPSQSHQTILTELLVQIRNYLKSKGSKCSVFPAPFDVKLSDAPLVIVQPDLMIVCDKDKLDGKRCNGAPDFIIEIVSPGTSTNDYIQKLYYYKTYGVREYWIVDPQRRVVTVYYFEKNLMCVTYSFDATVKVNIYDDFYVDFAELMKEITG